MVEQVGTLAGADPIRDGKRDDRIGIVLQLSDHVIGCCADRVNGEVGVVGHAWILPDRLPAERIEPE